MMNQLDQVEYHLQKIQALIPPSKGIKEYLRQTLDTQIAAISTATAMGITPASLLSPTRVYASARIAVEFVDDPQKLAAKPEGIVDLGIIEWLLRPALPLKDGLIEPVSTGPWQQFANNLVQQLEKSVCRLDILIEGYLPMHVGTGFVIANDAAGRAIVMTNAHIVEGALRYGWSSLTGIQFVCDFARYSSMLKADGYLFPLTHEYYIHPRYDLALLFLNPEVSQTSPTPLKLSANAPDPLVGLTIGVLGHPSFNSNVDPFPVYFGFGQDFGIKRFSPGYIRAIEQRYWRNEHVEVTLHDATTLSGSSGSCILNLNDMSVVGLHFGGWPGAEQRIQAGGQDVLAHLFESNGAVPLWTLINDPLLEGIF